MKLLGLPVYVLRMRPGRMRNSSPLLFTAASSEAEECAQCRKHHYNDFIFADERHAIRPTGTSKANTCQWVGRRAAMVFYLAFLIGRFLSMLFLHAPLLLLHAHRYPSGIVHTPQHHTLSGGPCISTGSAGSRLHAGQRGVGVRQAVTRFPASWPGKIAAFHSGPRHRHGRLSAVADAVKLSSM